MQNQIHTVLGASGTTGRAVMGEEKRHSIGLRRFGTINKSMTVETAQLEMVNSKASIQCLSILRFIV